MKSDSIINLMEEVRPILKDSYIIFDEITNHLEEIENLNSKRPDKKLSSDQKYLFTIGLIFFIFPGINYYRSFKSRNQKLNNEINEKIRILEEKIDILIEKYNCSRMDLYTKGITNIIPKNYLYPPSDAFDSILLYLKDHKTDDVKEAINLYRGRQHRLGIKYMPKEYTYEYILQLHGRYYADTIKKLI